MEIEFENKYVAFIDVLGFSALVERDDKKKLNTYFRVVESTFDIFDFNKAEMKKYIISDSIILIANDSLENFKLLLSAISNLQSSLAYFDIWVRGGVSFGPVYTDDQKNIIVGKGYIQAYHLEMEAKYPRVIIDPRIIAKLGFTLRTFCETLNGPIRPDNQKLIHDYWGGTRKTEDDAIFVGYAHKIIISAGKNDRRLRKLLGVETLLVDTIIENIRKNIYDQQKHYHKYLWLKKYFAEVLLELHSFRGDGQLDNDKLGNYLKQISSL